jgi:hypothetical protein
VSGFVADGHARGKRSLEYAAMVAVIRAEVDAEFEPLFREADLLGKIALWLERRRRIKQEIDELLPDDAYYA